MDFTGVFFYFRVLEWIERLQEEDVSVNRAMGKHGAEHILQRYNNDQPINIITHCNTGSLATAGYGTALGTVNPPMFQSDDIHPFSVVSLHKKATIHQ